MACVAMWPLVSGGQNMTISFPPSTVTLTVPGSTIYKSSALPAIDLRRRAMWWDFQRLIVYVKKRLVLERLATGSKAGRFKGEHDGR